MTDDHTTRAELQSRECHFSSVSAHAKRKTLMACQEILGVLQSCAVRWDMPRATAQQA